MRGKSVEELIERYDREVGNPSWVSPRARFLTALREALVATGFDCSSFIRDESISLARKLRREDDRIIPDERDPRDNGGTAVFVREGQRAKR